MPKPACDWCHVPMLYLCNVCTRCAMCCECEHDNLVHFESREGVLARRAAARRSQEKKRKLELG